MRSFASSQSILLSLFVYSFIDCLGDECALDCRFDSGLSDSTIAEWDDWWACVKVNKRDNCKEYLFIANNLNYLPIARQWDANEEEIGLNIWDTSRCLEWWHSHRIRSSIVFCYIMPWWMSLVGRVEMINARHPLRMTRIGWWKPRFNEQKKYFCSISR